MARHKIVDIDEENFELIPQPAGRNFSCKECFYWIGKKDGRLDQKQQKRKWFLRKGALYGSLGKLLFVSARTKEPVAFCQFAPIQEMSTAKLIYFKEKLKFPKNGWCITCVTVRSPWRRKGIASSLVRSVLRDLKKRKVKTVDVYPAEKKVNLSKAPAGPVDLWLSLGFALLNEGSATPVARKKL